jgi:glucose-6-phosphate 1-dehydrogenase
MGLRESRLTTADVEPSGGALDGAGVKEPRVTNPTQQDGPASDPGPTAFVLFGATGDLASRMVLPAFYRLSRDGLLPTQWRLVGNGRGEVTDESFRAHVHDALAEFGPKPEPRDWDAFAERVFFAGGGFSADDPGQLPEVLGDAYRALGGAPQLICYLAVPPAAFAGLTIALGRYGLAPGARVVYEKPFGTSQASFRELDRVVHSVLDEQQVYRIDHFLGKEATQDLHLLRFANGSSAAYWDRDHVESVQIDVPETIGISNRAQFYDAIGAVLDMVVTHLFQLAAEVAMEPPASLSATDLQDAREMVINFFRPLDPAEVVLGQFDGYRDVPGVNPHSTRDTFVAARLWIDNPRWLGVPFYLRTGKRMAASHQQVSLILREPPGPLTGQLPPRGNVLSFSLDGDGEIDLTLVAKKPGPALELGLARASIPLASLHGADPLPPYVRLIHDVILGDRSLFTRPDGLAAVWDTAEPLLSAPPPVSAYPPGSWGPAQARDLVAPGNWLLGQ